MKAIFWLLILIVLFTWAGWFSLGHCVGERRARERHRLELEQAAESARAEQRVILRHAAELAVQGRTQELADWYERAEEQTP